MLRTMRMYKFACILAILFVAIFGGINGNAHAESMGAEIEVFSSLTFNISAREIELNLDPIKQKFDSKDLTITIGTDSPAGYKLFMSSVSGGTSLINTADSSKTIPTLPANAGGYTKDNFVNNKWGYRKNGGNYVPFVSGTALVEKNTAAASDTTTLGFASQVDASQSPGTYALEISFLVVVNPTGN